MYDQYGEDGVGDDDGPGGGHDPMDIFSSLFGGAGGGGGSRSSASGGKRKGKDMVHQISVTLADLYNGRTIKLAITRDTICKDCNGSGGKDGATETDCSDCKGRGMKVIVRQMGPMIQQMSSPCTTCRGTGKILPEEKRCKTCTGSKTVKEKKQLTVEVEKGMKDHQRIVKRGEAGDAPGVEPGDVVFVLSLKTHPTFQRSGDDLIMVKDIPLIDALTGASFTLRHLNNKKLRVTSAKGEVIQPGQVKMVKNAGMPKLGSGGIRYGDLIIKCNVVLPSAKDMTKISTASLKTLIPRTMDDKHREDAKYRRARGEEEAGDAEDDVHVEDDNNGSSSSKGNNGSSSSKSPSKKSPTVGDDDNVDDDDTGDFDDAVLVDCDLKAKAAERQEDRHHHSSSGEAYDEDDESGGGGGQRVQCAQQ